MPPVHRGSIERFVVRHIVVPPNEDGGGGDVAGAATPAATAVADNNGTNNSDEEPEDKEDKENGENAEEGAMTERKRSHNSNSSSDDDTSQRNGSMIANTSQNPIIELSPRNPRQRKRLNAVTNVEEVEDNDISMMWDNAAHNTTNSLTPSFSTPVRGAEGGMTVEPIIVSSPLNPSIPKPPAPPMLDVNDLVMRDVQFGRKTSWNTKKKSMT